MYQQPAYVNLVGSWLLTFMLTSGQLAGLTTIGFWWAAAPVLATNGFFAGRAIMRGLLLKDEADED